jgi:catalase-peroxidase
MAWHSAGTYRTGDGRGGASSGTQRFAPLNSWPDNANLDKARRLLWPIKQKYGRKISWADLMILAGNVALESMGFKTFGFGGGREDVWEPERTSTGAPRPSGWATSATRGDRELENPLAAVQMGLIYVNPEGPNGKPDPLAVGRDIRETFARMAMNDEETVALIAGGHTFGKCHGAGPTRRARRPRARGRPLEEQGLGWKNSYKSGKGGRHDHQRPRGRLDAEPDQVGHGYFDNLFGYEWELTKSPAARGSGRRRERQGDRGARRARPNKKHAPMMFTDRHGAAHGPDLREDLEALPREPDEFADAFARAWFKLTHRDMGPNSRYLGPEVPEPELIWQDPVPAVDHELIDSGKDIAELKAKILAPACRPSWSRPRGRRPRPSATATSAAAPTAPASASRRRRTGTSTSRPSWRRC